MTLPNLLEIKEKPSMDPPTYIVSQLSPTEQPKSTPSSGRIQKKHVLFAVSGMAVAGLIVAAILIGMHMFSEAQKDIVKFSLQFKSSDNQQAKQDVESDPNDNVVMYHVTKPGQDVYVVNDFNRDLQIVKIQTDDSTNCYLSALNRTGAMDPSQITEAASSTESDGAHDQTFILSNTPVSDTSFLPKKAATMCKGVSVYWAYRHCGGQNVEDKNLTHISDDRNKRAITLITSLHGLTGKNACCLTTWACSVRIVEVIQGTRHICTTYATTGTCCDLYTIPYCYNVYIKRTC